MERREKNSQGKAGKAKASTRQLPGNIVTKDSNLDVSREAFREQGLNASHEQDFGGFVTKQLQEEGDYGNSFETSYSRTIDDNMLPLERFKRRGKNNKSRSKSRSTMFLVDDAERFDPDVETGLSHEQVESRHAAGLVNFNKKKTSKSLGRIFFQNFVTPINLIAAAVATMLLIFEAPIQQLFFVIIIFINTGIGIFQEIRAKITVEKLSIMTAPTATVIRGGERMVVPVAEVVLDDIMYVEAGKQICADSIVVQGEAEANEAMLTGESLPERKIIGNTLYSGSFLSGGACFAKVNKVGAANYVETLTSHAKKYKKPKSELFVSINFFIKIIIPLAIALTAATIISYWAVNIRGIENLASDAWNRNVWQAAGVMVGMLPVGMFLLTSTALFVSVIRLGKKKALVKDFNCIESLARVDVLCLDKTGTITDGSMSVKEVVEIKGASDLEYSIADIIGSILTATGDNNQTARALAEHFGYSKMLTPTTILPFNSARKLAAVTTAEAGTFLYGAPEFVLKDLGIRVEKLVSQYAREGYRVLCLAHSPAAIVGDRLPVTRRPLCLVVIEDFIREDAISTVAWFKENNVAVKVISGDNPITVSEVAKRVGVEKAENYISLEGLSEREVQEAAPKYTVFGRVTPEQKKLLVVALKQKGHTVAMTGDGVNDILAMRESDCAIAIASGAEAARNIAHLVLQDSNFNSMPAVVLEGRKVINNIQKTSALFLMKTIMTAVLAVIFVFLQEGFPFNTNHLLLMEIIVIALASFALALQDNNKPVKGKFLSNVLGRSAPGGLTLAASIMAIYLFRTFLMDTGLHGETWRYIDGVGQYVPAINYAYTTLIVLAVTFTSFIVLVKICEPPDRYRVVMLVVIGALLALGAFVVPRLINPFDIFVEYVLALDVVFLLATVLGSYFFMSVLIRVMKAIGILKY